MARSKGAYTSVSADLVFGASAGIEGIAALAVAIVGIYGLFRITVRGDVARKCFWWFYAALAFTFLSYILGMTAAAIYAFFYNSTSYDVEAAFNLLLDGRRLEPVGRFFRRTAAAICAVTVAETAGSISMVASSSSLRLHRAAVYASSIVATGLALAECILAARLANTDENPRLDDRFNIDMTTAAVGAVAIIVLIVGSVLVLLTAGKATKAAHKTVERPSIFTFLAALCLCVVRFWNIAEVTLLLAPRRQASKDIAWFWITDAIMDRWGTTAVLLLIYYVGVVKKGGLWSAG